MKLTSCYGDEIEVTVRKRDDYQRPKEISVIISGSFADTPYRAIVYREEIPQIRAWQYLCQPRIRTALNLVLDHWDRL